MKTSVVFEDIIEITSFCIMQLGGHKKITIPMLIHISPRINHWLELKR